MKKKVLSLILSTAMVASLAACGSSTTESTTTESGDTAATQSADATATDAAAEEAGSYELTDLYITVDGTLTANVDNGQDAFVEQWEKAVSEKLGHDTSTSLSTQVTRIT